MNNFIQQEHIKLIKSDCKYIDNATKSISNKINVVLYWSKDPEKGV